MKLFFAIALISLTHIAVFAQNLEDLLDETIVIENEPEVVSATFKSVQLINSHTIKPPTANQLIFLISHRFGFLNSGFSDLFGLDNATVRFGFEYGINNKLAIGFGRSTYKRNYDLFAKYALLQQSSGANNMPISLSFLGVTNISSAKWTNPDRAYLFAHRMSYSAQFLIARKFNKRLSLQLMPTYIHRNLVVSQTDKNDILALGSGGRLKLSNWVALTFEYHYLLSSESTNNTYNPLSLGVDLETGGHVFQLFFTNTSAVYDAAIIGETTDSWLNGDIRFGFNISRTF